MDDELEFPLIVQALENSINTLEVYRRILLEHNADGRTLNADADLAYVLFRVNLLWQLTPLPEPLVFRHRRDGKVLQISFDMLVFDDIVKESK